MSKRLVVIADSDALIAQANFKDKHHKKAIVISKILNDRQALILYPATTIAETTAYMQRVLNSNATAYSTAEYFTNSRVNILEVNQQTLTKAFGYFSSKASKKNTLFDCIVAALAEKHHADAIFSFDKFYKKRGFKLASELK